MQKEQRRSEGEASGVREPYDLTEEASKRGGDEEATTVARNLESDDSNEETNLGQVPGPDGDSNGENRVTTSLSDD